MVRLLITIDRDALKEVLIEMVLERACDTEAVRVRESKNLVFVPLPENDGVEEVEGIDEAVGDSDCDRGTLWETPVGEREMLRDGTPEGLQVREFDSDTDLPADADRPVSETVRLTEADREVDGLRVPLKIHDIVGVPDERSAVWLADFDCETLLVVLLVMECKSCETDWLVVALRDGDELGVEDIE